jgi:hypothetical protein
MAIEEGTANRPVKADVAIITGVVLTKNLAKVI